MANVTLFVSNIEVKYYTANLLIVNQLQNSFIFSGPPAVFLYIEKYFRFLYIFYILY